MHVLHTPRFALRELHDGHAITGHCGAFLLYLKAYD